MFTRITVGQVFEREFPGGPRQAEVVEAAADRRKGKFRFLDDSSIMEALAVQLNDGWRLIPPPV
jgi:hypothetical protein